MSTCYVTDCRGFGQWQMGLMVWTVGADPAASPGEVIALAFACCETHRLNAPEGPAVLPPAAIALANAGRSAAGLTALDFTSSKIVFREYITNGGEWHR
jgi:hypothetical protein